MRTRSTIRSLVGSIAAVVAGTSMAIGTCVASSAGGPVAGAAEARTPRLLGIPTVTQTWSSGPLADAGDPIAQSSPIPVTLGGTPSVVVGDRGAHLFAFGLGNPTPASPVPTPVIPAGWRYVHTNSPIDSTPSVAPVAGGASAVLVGSGNDPFPTNGGYQAFNTDGSLRWITSVVNPPSDTVPAGGVFAGMSVGALQGVAGGPSSFAGSLGQVSYALEPSSGAALPGWPYLNTDSTHATAAIADLYGTGRNEVIEASDQSQGFGNGQNYKNGGVLRVLTGTGNLICRAVTNQTLDSSPAVGGFLGNGATGIVVGTGGYFPGASDTGTVKAYDTHCHLVWSTDVGGNTFSSPALSDVRGNGRLDVVEGTDNGIGSGGSVSALNGATGAILWSTPLAHRVIGSVTTADLFGQGYNDVLAPTTNGLYVLDGRTGAQVGGVIDENLGLQNSPLVTTDPNGTVGITLAGYIGSQQGQVDHFEIVGSIGPAAIGTRSWPMFHHDPQLTGDAGGTPAVGSIAICSIPSAAFSGYDVVAGDGGVSTYPTTGQPFCGSAGALKLTAPVVGMAMSPATGGYWLVASDGGIFAYGDARFYGSMGGSHLNQPIVGMAATSDGGGYWLVASDGGIFAFGDAQFYGSMGGSHLNKPIVGIAAMPDDSGYWLVASDGGFFAYGDAPFYGSMGGSHLNKPIVGMARDPNSGGYWLVASDGGIFAYGGAPFLGSTGAISLVAPVVGMASTVNGSGYRFAAADGGIFSYSAPFFGSVTARPVAPVVGMSGF